MKSQAILSWHQTHLVAHFLKIQNLNILQCKIYLEHFTWAIIHLKSFGVRLHIKQLRLRLNFKMKLGLKLDDKPK